MIRILIAVEVPFYREGLAELLNKSGEVQVAAAASDAESAERLARIELPDLVLFDVGMADIAEAIERLRVLPSPPKLVALAVNETPEAVLTWIEHGVAAYVPRSAALEDLLSILKGVAHEEFHCSPRMAAHIIHRMALLASGSRSGASLIDELSPREHEVLSLLARGLPNKAIARHLEISNATAKNHVHNILEKLRLHRRSEVASLMSESHRRSA
ncbi:MAG: response regulator transcription factor [Betaproteobacteria bacterium]|nr:response regulator transcription factor [Betaproteobacteria bacterium]